ncbi:MAG: FAD-dependent oxidoreductase [Pseudomonadota bacterium]
MQKKHVVIVGGGYVGVELAKGLEQQLNVTLIEPREVFVHAPAMLRGLVDPAVRERALIPYDRLLKHGKLIHDRVITVLEDRLVLASGDEIAGDFIVLSPGASNGGIFKPADEGIDQFQSAQQQVQTQIASASSITIVGAGAVGVELAGEIAYAYPDKSVTLISAQAELFPDFQAKLGQSLNEKLIGLGVELILGQRVTDLNSSTEPYAGMITLANGQTMSSDLIIPAIGSRPQTSLFSDMPSVQQSPDGRIQVDPYLRPSSWSNVFAAGDAIDAGDSMTIVSTSRQTPWLIKTIRSLAAGKSLDSLKAYTPWKSPPILVPLGPERGSSYLFIATFGDWVTRNVKGKELCISKYRKLLNYE